MAKAKHRIVTTDAEIDAAIAEGERNPPHAAVGAIFDPVADVIAIQLANGIELRVPRGLIEGLRDATPDELVRIEIEGGGTELVWPAIDVAHHVPGLVDGVFGTRRWMAEIGRRGGARRSKAKAAAARANGAKGGRPARS